MWCVRSNQGKLWCVMRIMRISDKKGKKYWLVNSSFFWRPERKKGRHWSSRHDELLKKDSSLVNSSWPFWKKWLVTDQLVMTSSWSWRAWRVISWRLTSWLVMTSDELTSIIAIPGLHNAFVNFLTVCKTSVCSHCDCQHITVIVNSYKL